MSSVDPHPDNIRPDGSYDERLYDLEYEKDGKGRYRVIRGLGNHIGYVVKDGYGWATETTEGCRFGHLWQLRWVAGAELSHKVPLTADADPEQFRVTKDATA